MKGRAIGRKGTGDTIVTAAHTHTQTQTHTHTHVVSGREEGTLDKHFHLKAEHRSCILSTTHL